MADQYEESQSPAQRKFQSYPQRSAASHNWRQKDDAPRADPQPRQQRPSRGGTGSYGSPGAPRDQNQPRELSETRLYVGNLLYSASKDDIVAFFAENGFNVSNLSMSIDPETGKNPSYCFADFATAEEAQRAMSELNGQDVLGRTVRISPGVKKQEGGFGGASRGGYSGGRGGWGSREDTTTNSQPAPRYNSRANSNPADQENAPPSKRLYIGNLPAISPQSSVDEAITSILAPLNIETSNIGKLIAPHESKSAEPGDHHFLFVDLVRPEDVDRAIESLDGKATGFTSEGGLLRVNRAREQKERGPRVPFRQGPHGQGYEQREGGFGGQREGGFRDRRADGNRDVREWRVPKQEPA